MILAISFLQHTEEALIVLAKVETRLASVSKCLNKIERSIEQENDTRT